VFASGVILLQLIVAWQASVIRIKQRASPEGSALGRVKDKDGCRFAVRVISNDSE
jgi:hypothetical protein